MRRFTKALTTIFAAGATWWACPLAAADQPSNDERAVREADQAFWGAFNRCDRAEMSERFTDDAEFYHDKTGLTQSRQAVTASMFTGPCANPAAMRLRRAAVPGTERYYPLAGGFALLEGEHHFLATETGKPERHDSVARFMEVWQQTADGVWRMRRVVSFDHRPDEPTLAATPLSAREARSYVGTYVDEDGSSSIVSANGGLTLQSGNATFPLVRLAAGRFGTPGRWLEFRFAGDSVTVVEEGHQVARAKRINPFPHGG